MARRLFYFLTLVGHVSEKASLASLVVMLRSRRPEQLALVDYDESTRRIVLRFAPSEIGFVRSLLGRYLDSAPVEVKARTRLRLDLRRVREAGGAVERTPSAVLALVPCGDGMVFIEQRGREALLKYCARPVATVLPTPSGLPPSMCAFEPASADMLALYERARSCFEEVARAVSSSGDEGG